MTTNILRTSRIANQLHESTDEQLPSYVLEPTDLPPSYESVCSANSFENEYSQTRNNEYILIRNTEYVTPDNSDTNVWVDHFHATETNAVPSSIVSSSSITNLTAPGSTFSQLTGASNTSFRSARTSVSDATVIEDNTTGMLNNFSHNSILQHPLANISCDDDSITYDNQLYKKILSDKTPIVHDDILYEPINGPLYMASPDYGTRFQDSFGFFNVKTAQGLKFRTTQFQASETDRITAFSSQAGISNIFFSSEKGEYLEKLTEIKNRDIINQGSCVQDNFKVKRRRIVNIMIETSNTNKKDKTEISITRLKFIFSDKTSEKFGVKKFKNVTKNFYRIAEDRRLSHISVCYGTFSIRGISFTTKRVSSA
ncbi:hypothetical protein B5S33_g5741 [[Candida] boidinii]|nr:hypothetical protein B5S33_g5741 [[Candida] boidinii]